MEVTHIPTSGKLFVIKFSQTHVIFFLPNILAGPSDIGLDQPAQSTIISLKQITLALIMYKMNLDTIVIGKVLNEYGDKVSKEFLEVARSIDSESLNF